MTIYALTIDFRGVCTHFHHNFVPGVPHRVVLPNASAFMVGLLGVPTDQNPIAPAWQTYALLPHVPSLSVDGEATPPLASLHALFADNGYLITPCQLQILNAIDDGVSYPPFTTPAPGDPSDPTTSFLMTVPQLTTFVSTYTPSEDVIRQGRASAYFDIFAGRIDAFADGSEIRVRATILTDGPPQLGITPLTPGDQPASGVIVTLAPPTGTPPDSPIPITMRFGNIGACKDGISNYDFLLHYLTDVAGIPRNLTASLPGMNEPDPCPQEGALEILKELFEHEFPRKFPASLNDAFSETSASCSDSRYP